MATEVTKSGVIFRILAAINPVTWNRVSFWTKAADVHFSNGESGDDLATRLGSIAGITSDPSSDSQTVAASAYMVHGYNNGYIATLSKTGWTTGVTANGSTYATQEVQCTKVWTANPIVILGTTVADQVVPSEAESTQYNNVAHVVADTSTNKVKFYASSVPTENLKVIIKGAI